MLECDGRLGAWEASPTPSVQLGQLSKPVRVLQMAQCIGVNKMECDTISRDHIDAMTVGTQEHGRC